MTQIILASDVTILTGISVGLMIVASVGCLFAGLKLMELGAGQFRGNLQISDHARPHTPRKIAGTIVIVFGGVLFASGPVLLLAASLISRVSNNKPAFDFLEMLNRFIIRSTCIAFAIVLPACIVAVIIGQKRKSMLRMHLPHNPLDLSSVDESHLIEIEDEFSQSHPVFRFIEIVSIVILAMPAAAAMAPFKDRDDTQSVASGFWLIGAAFAAWFVIVFLIHVISMLN